MSVKFQAQSSSALSSVSSAGELNGTTQQGQPAAPPLSLSERIAQLEWQVQSDPENAAGRTMLVNFYQQMQQNDKALEQLLWIVQHHPEWREASITTIVKPEGGRGFTVPDYQQLKTAWEGALVDHSDSPEVLYNGGMFLQGSEGERALQLFQQARQLQPSKSNYLQAIAGIYEAAASNDPQGAKPIALSADLGTRLRAELPTLRDPALLSRVGSDLARMGPHSPDNPNWQLGISLLERAATLEPANPRWSEALSTAKSPAAPQGEIPPGAVRIGRAVAESNLVRKAEPIYPEEARTARVSGTVEFTAAVGTDGHVQNLQLVRGHPLLVNAAKEAALQYVYKPTLLNGKPVAVVTSINIGFQLPPQ